LQGTPSNNTQEANVGGNKGKGKVDQTYEIEKTSLKKQFVVNASLIGKGQNILIHLFCSPLRYIIGMSITVWSIQDILQMSCDADPPSLLGAVDIQV